MYLLPSCGPVWLRLHIHCPPIPLLSSFSVGGGRLDSAALLYSFSSVWFYLLLMTEGVIRVGLRNSGGGFEKVSVLLNSQGSWEKGVGLQGSWNDWEEGVGVGSSGGDWERDRRQKSGGG